MPPFHSGIVPSLLPARSAPTGVNGVPVTPSLDASPLAWTPAEKTAHAISSARPVRCWRVITPLRISDLHRAYSARPVSCVPDETLRLASERILDDKCHEVAIVDQVQVTRAPVIGVAQVERELVEVVRLGADGERFAAFDECSAGSGRNAVDVLGERDARRQREGGAPVSYTH